MKIAQTSEKKPNIKKEALNSRKKHKDGKKTGKLTKEHSNLKEEALSSRKKH